MRKILAEEPAYLEELEAHRPPLARCIDCGGLTFGKGRQCAACEPPMSQRSKYESMVRARCDLPDPDAGDYERFVTKSNGQHAYSLRTARSPMRHRTY